MQYTILQIVIGGAVVYFGDKFLEPLLAGRDNLMHFVRCAIIAWGVLFSTGMVDKQNY